MRKWNRIKLAVQRFGSVEMERKSKPVRGADHSYMPALERYNPPNDLCEFVKYLNVNPSEM